MTSTTSKFSRSGPLAMPVYLNQDEFLETPVGSEQPVPSRLVRDVAGLLPH